jgi:hypothetical protein
MHLHQPQGAGTEGLNFSSRGDCQHCGEVKFARPAIAFSRAELK